MLTFNLTCHLALTRRDLAPEPSEPLTIMKPASETRRWGPGTGSPLLPLDRKQLCYPCLLTGQILGFDEVSFLGSGRRNGVGGRVNFFS